MFQQDPQLGYKAKLGRSGAIIFVMENVINITYSKCMYVALVTWYAMRMRMRSIILSFFASLIPNIIFISPTLSHKRSDFRTNDSEHKMYYDFLNKFCLKHFSFPKDFRKILSKVYIGVCVKYRVYMSGFKKYG